MLILLFCYGVEFGILPEKVNFSNFSFFYQAKTEPNMRDVDLRALSGRRGFSCFGNKKKKKKCNYAEVGQEIYRKKISSNKGPIGTKLNILISLTPLNAVLKNYIGQHQK